MNPNDMTPQEVLTCFKNINETLYSIRREQLRSRSRIKALEAMVRNSIPKENRSAWHEQLNKEMKFILHQYLVSIEKQNPAFAASLDDRELWEVGDDF
jgi:hypothetical protein